MVGRAGKGLPAGEVGEVQATVTAGKVERGEVLVREVENFEGEEDLLGGVQVQEAEAEAEGGEVKVG